MSEPQWGILNLRSVLLTQEKQSSLEYEFETYHAATNFVIKERLRRTLTNPTRTIQVLQDEFSERFDSREQYLIDVVRTAGSEVKAHQRLARTIRSMRDKTPHFKSGRIILSKPIITVGKMAVVLRSKDGSEIPVPFDKRSRNRVLDKLEQLAQDKSKYGRIRLTWREAGYVDIDIRARL